MRRAGFALFFSLIAFALMGAGPPSDRPECEVTEQTVYGGAAKASQRGKQVVSSAAKGGAHPGNKGGNSEAARCDRELKDVTPAKGPAGPKR